MKFRTARPGDETGIDILYEEAKASMRELGIDQWQRGVPSRETAAADIAAGICRVAEEDGRIAASCDFVPGGEEDYRKIDGAWLTEGEDYAAMHRVAVSRALRGRGVGSLLIGSVLREAQGRGFSSVRVDTHPGNLPMQRLLAKNGFTLCGKIRLVGGPDDGALRLAYEKMVQPRVIDISQELFSSQVYPGDLAPAAERVSSISAGDIVNVTNLHMCAHNGTHMDAPLHFFDGTASVAQMPPEQFFGEADVVECRGVFGAGEAERLIPAGCRRLLLRGGAIPDEEGARAIVRAGITLIGVEPQSVGPMDAPAAVHRILLGAGIAVLEGIRLEKAPAGRYLLSAAPLLCEGADGAPVRALLYTL